MERKKVSIIIPVYNGEEYMREAIDSALAQTYENIEIIVVNDGSRDNTDKIALSYGDKIVYIKKENGGVSTALNLAIENMTGDYFSWLSHDDRYYPEKVSEEIKYLEDNGLLDEKVILYSDYDLMNENSEVFAGSVKDHKLLKKKGDYCILRGEINGLSLLIPKKAFDECGKFRTDLRCVQDYVLWEDMRAAGYKFIHIPKILVTTRLHSMQQGNTSPVMVSEGNEFWTNLIKNTSQKRMVEFEGSPYMFYKKMNDIMITTPYNEAADFTKQECDKILAEAKEKAEGVKVSVVLFVKDGFETLKRAIDSVCRQTHKCEILISCADDYADLGAVRDYVSGLDIDIKVITDSDKKEKPAKANGEYIAFMSSSDVFAENKTEKQLTLMIAANSNFSHTNYIVKNLQTQNEVDTSMLCGDVFDNITGETQANISTVMVKSSFLKENGIKSGEDVCFIIDCMKKTPVLSIKEPLTTIYANEKYFSRERRKRLTGIKEIAKIMLNDEELSAREYDIGVIFKNYIMQYDSMEGIKKINEPPLPKRSILRRALSSLKHKGLFHTLKAGIKKIKRRLK